MTTRTHASLPCRELTSAVDTYVDGELGPSQIVEVETHLARCCSCREHVALTKAIRSSLRGSALKAPSSLRERLKAACEAERAASKQARPDATAPSSSLDERAGVAVVLAAPRARVARGDLPGADAPTVIVAAAEPSAPVAWAGRCASAEVAALSSVPSVADAPSRVGPSSQRRWARPSGPLRSRYALPFAVAAGVAFAISMRKAPSQVEGSRAAAAVSEAAVVHPASTGLDGILDDLVALHAQPLPPEVTREDDVRRFDPFVGVPVQAPELQPFGAKWVGGRMLPLRESRAAALQYSLAGGHRVTVYVYDPRRVKQESRQLQHRIVRNAPVFVGNVRGYNVAATERRGVGYALATDLDERESLELMVASPP